jgi:hypothetical protein
MRDEARRLLARPAIARWQGKFRQGPFCRSGKQDRRRTGRRTGLHPDLGPEPPLTADDVRSRCPSAAVAAAVVAVLAAVGGERAAGQ